MFITITRYVACGASKGNMKHLASKRINYSVVHAIILALPFSLSLSPRFGGCRRVSLTTHDNLVVCQACAYFLGYQMIVSYRRKHIKKNSFEITHKQKCHSHCCLILFISFRSRYALNDVWARHVRLRNVDIWVYPSENGVMVKNSTMPIDVDQIPLWC